MRWNEIKIESDKITLTCDINYRNIIKIITGENFVELNIRTDELNNLQVDELLKEIEKLKYKQVKITIEKEVE